MKENLLPKQTKKTDNFLLEISDFKTIAHALGPSNSKKPQLKHHIIMNSSSIVKHEFHLERVVKTPR